MARTMEIDGDIALLLAEFHRARTRRQQAGPGEAAARALADEQAAALSLALCLDNRTQEGA